NQRKLNRCETLRVPNQEFVEDIGNDVPEGAPIIDCRLAAFSAPMSLQLCSTIFTVCNRRTLNFPAAEKSPPPRRRLFDCRDGGVTQDKFFKFIGHTSARLQKSFCRVYALIQGVNEQAPTKCDIA